MKSILVLLLFLTFNLTSVAQIDFDNPPWGTECYTLASQSEINVCSYENFMIADSILNTYYNSLLTYIDSQYKNELLSFVDTTNNFQKDYLKQIKGQKEAVIKSKKDFDTFRSSTAKIIEYEYKGGTIQPMVVNNYSLDLTVNQIKVLINLMEDIIVK